MPRPRNSSSLRWLLILFLVGIFLAIAFVWPWTENTPLYVAHNTDYRLHLGPDDWVAGRQASGLYLGGGKIGFLHHIEQSDMLEDSNIAQDPPQPGQWEAERSENPDQNAQGGMSLDEVGDSISSEQWGFHAYDGSDGWAGGTQFIRGYLIDTRLVFGFLLAVLALITWRNTRGRRARRRGLSPKCFYDVRVQIGGMAEPICPECGTPIARR